MLNQELRHTTRGLIRRPVFTFVVVLTLALGIGANTAIFSAVWSLMLAPLPFPAGDRMGYLWDTTEAGFQIVPSSDEFEAFVRESRTLEWIEPYSSRTMAWRTDGTADVIDAAMITSTLPLALDVEPIRGRTFTDSETQAAGAGVAVVSETFWNTRLGASPDIIDSTIQLEGRPWQVVGVLPDRFSRFMAFGRSPDVYVPLVRKDGDRLNLLAVRRPGITTEQVGDELTAIAANVAGSKLGQDQRTRMEMPNAALGENTRTALVVLLAAVGLVLLIACANVAGLLLIRGSERRRELAIRASLGASRWALFRHLSVETALLALAGGVTGLLTAAWGVDLVRTIRPGRFTEFDAVSLDSTVLAFAVGITILTAVLFGLIPSLHATRADLRTQVTVTSGGSTAAPASNRAGAILVIAEIAIAVVLLVGASLLVRTMIALHNAPLGFNPAGILTFSIELPEDRYPSQSSYETFAARLIDELRAMPNTELASLASGLPPRLGVLFGELRLEETNEPIGDRLMFGAAVDRDFFRLLRIPILEGRALDGTEADRRSVILNRTTAQRFWPGGSAIGKRIRFGSGDPLTVVGVTPDIAVMGPRTSLDRPQIFRPTSDSMMDFAVAVRVRSGDPLALVPAIREIVSRIDPALPLQSVSTLDAMLAESVGPQRFNLILFGTFAGLALVLATVGLYGVIAFEVSRRTREYGIRAALGASPRGVLRRILARGASVAIAGAAIGGVAAIALTGFMTQMLHGVPARDPVSFGAAIAAVIGVSLLATWMPARRASRVDPIVTLRTE